MKINNKFIKKRNILTKMLNILKMDIYYLDRKCCDNIIELEYYSCYYNNFNPKYAKLIYLCGIIKVCYYKQCLILKGPNSHYFKILSSNSDIDIFSLIWKKNILYDFFIIYFKSDKIIKYYIFYLK